MKRVASYFSWQTLLLFLILILAVFLRFYQLDKQTWWMSGDDARDMLVIRHIVEYGETISRGPFALGGFGWLKNSPVYYYFLAFFWFVTKSAKGVMYLWAGLLTLPVLLAYLMVEKIHHKSSALLAALVFAINPYMINVSKNLTQVHLSVIFSTSFIYFLVNYLSSEKKRLLNLLGMISSAFLAFHFHYNIILVFPSLFLLILIAYWRLNFAQKKFFSLYSVLPVLLALFLFITWLVSTHTVKVFDQFTFLKINSSLSERSLSASIFYFWNACLLLFRLVWGELYVKLMTPLLLGLLLFLILKKNHLSDTPLKTTINYFLLILSSIFLIFLYQGSVEETYFLFLLPIILLLLSLSLTLLFEQIKYCAWPITAGIIFLLFWSGIKYNFGNFHSMPVYEKKNLLARIIARDYIKLYPATKTTQQPQILLIWDSQVFHFMNDSWGNSGVWFHLEDVFQQQLVKLIHYGPNYQPIIENPKVIYKICHYDNNHAKITNCFSNFLEKYPVHQSDIYKLYEDEEIALLRAEIKMSLSRPVVNQY